MTSPQSPPDLNIVSPASSETSERSAPEPRVSPAKSSGVSQRIQPRRGVPIWVVLVVAALGAGLFIDQYQRAEQLTAQVGALETELAVADQKLVAYQTHLEIVRSGVGDLSERVASLHTLVSSDPLAPAAEAGEVTLSGAAPLAPSPAQATTQSTLLGDASTVSPAPPTGRDVIAPALSAPVTPDLSTSGDSVRDFSSDLAQPDFGSPPQGERSAL